MNEPLSLDYLGPSQPIGLLILLTGIIFTTVIAYIFYTLDKDSSDEVNRKKIQSEVQQKKIKRLYPPD